MSGAPQLVEPDDVPGPFYVSAFDGGRFLGLLSGPYTRHRDAVALVERAHALAQAIDPRVLVESQARSDQLARRAAVAGLGRHGVHISGRRATSSRMTRSSAW